MKNFLLIIAVFIAKGNHAQDVVQNYLSKDKTLIVKESISGRNDVNMKVMRSFKKMYPDVKDEKWEVIDNFLFVTFCDRAVKNRAVYRNNGQLDYSIRYYAEKDLPSVVRGIVKSIYYDYSITQVEELNVKNKLIYLVHVVDPGTFKMVRVCDGQLEEIESFNRG